MNKNINLGSVLLGSEAFLLAENFKQNKKSIIFIASDDREIFDIILKTNLYNRKISIPCINIYS